MSVRSSSVPCQHGPHWGDIVVSVLVLNWNGIRYLGPCLDSLFATACRHVEVVLIDNGSTDNSVQFVSDRYPALRVLTHDRNLGFGRSYNVAMSKTRGQYVVFLNNDTTVDRGWLSPLIDELLANPEVGITTSLQLFMGTTTIVTAGGSLRLWQGTSEQGYGLDVQTARLTPIGDAFFASGAAMAISRELFQRLNGFDESLSLYCEDLDISWRARLAGFRVVCMRLSVVNHHISGTSGPYKPQKLRLVVNHHLQVMIKCLAWHNLVYAVPGYLAFTLAMAALLSVLERNVAYLTCAGLAIMELIPHRGDLLGQRRVTQAQRQRRDRQVFWGTGVRLMDPPWVLLRHLRKGMSASRKRRQLAALP